MRRALTFLAMTGIWTLPIIRAFQLFRYSSGVFSEDGSINAWNDYAFSRALLVSYFFCLAVGIFLTWLFFRRRDMLMAIPLSGAFLIAFGIILARPESVIVLFPTMHPLLPALFSIFALLAAVVIHWLPRSERHDDGASHNAV